MITKFSHLQYKAIETKKDYIEFYRNKNNADEYALKTSKGLFPAFTQIEIQSVLEIAKKYKKLNESRLLDLAMGNGRITKYLEKHFKYSTGIDSSQTMVNLAKKNLKHSRLLKADVEKLPFENEEFDIITCFRFLINIPPKNRQKMFKEIKRVLKKNGIFFVQMHINKLSIRGIKDILTNKRPARKMVSYFEMKRELKKQGFKIAEIHGVNLQILNRLLPFLPISINLKIDRTFNKLPYVNLFSDNLIIAVVKSQTTTF